MALPRYRQLKVKLSKLFVDIFTNAAKSELGPFQEARKFRQHEGKVLRHNTLDNNEKQRQINYQVFTTEYKVEYAKVPSTKPEEIIALMQQKGKEFGTAQAKHGYSVMTQVTEEMGNVVNNKNQPFTIDSYLEVMDKIQIDFDNEGKPVWPTMVVAPGNFEKAKSVIREMETNPKARERMEKILVKKKETYDADQARRKLVD